jgi:hypothetical protein
MFLKSFVVYQTTLPHIPQEIIQGHRRKTSNFAWLYPLTGQTYM